MNQLYPHFDFDKCLHDFVVILSTLEYPENKKNFTSQIRDFWINSLDQAKEDFFDQNHILYDETREDLCSYYLEQITLFSCFMRYIMNGDRNIIELVAFIILLRFPSTTHPVAIAKNLLKNKIYSTKERLFYPKIVQQLKEFCQKHQITFKDGN